MSDTYETDGYANPGHEGEEYDGDGYEGAGRDPASGGAEVSAPGQERTFAALPPARGRGFAESWWGRAWLQALEDTALDGAQVKKGRRLAREGGSARSPYARGGSPQSSRTGTRPRTAVMSCSSS